MLNVPVTRAGRCLGSAARSSVELVSGASVVVQNEGLRGALAEAWSGTASSCRGRKEGGCIVAAAAAVAEALVLAAMELGVASR